MKIYNINVSDDRSNAFKRLAKDMEAIEEKDKNTRKEKLRSGLQERQKELKNGSQSLLIENQMSRIAKEAGYSIFTDAQGKIKSPKIRRKNYIEILAREMLLIAVDEMKSNSKVFTLESLRNYFNTNRTNWELKEGDLQDAANYLAKQQLISKLITTDEGILIYFRPIELGNDPERLLILASGMATQTLSSLVCLTGWQQSRVEQSLVELEKVGVISRDSENIYFLNLY